MDPTELMATVPDSEPSGPSQVEVDSSSDVVHTQLSDVGEDVDEEGDVDDQGSVDATHDAHQHEHEPTPTPQEVVVDVAMEVVDGHTDVHGHDDGGHEGNDGDREDTDNDDGHVMEVLAGTPTGDTTMVATATVDDDGSEARRRSKERHNVSRLRVNDKGEPTMMLPSFIWDYFIKEANGKFVVCTLCPANVTRFAYSGGTSTMNRHLRKKHQKYAPGKTQADYAYPKAAKRALLAAALANGSAGSSTTGGVTETSVAAMAMAASPASSTSSSVHNHNPHLAATHPGVHNSNDHIPPQNLSPSSTSASNMAAMMGSLSPSEATHRQLLDLRNARRRATTAKRRKLIHGMLDTEQYAAVHSHPQSGSSSTLAAANTSSTTTTTHQVVTEFDPSAFVTLHNTPSHGSNPTHGSHTGGLHFPPGFELGDGGSTIDAAALAAAVAAAAANAIAGSTTSDGRLLDFGPASLLHSGGAMISNNNSNTPPNMAAHHSLYVPRNNLSLMNNRSSRHHKMLTHRLLKYLIAQYEPLDVSRMGSELGALVSGAATSDWNGYPSSHHLYHHHATDHYSSAASAKFLPSEETLKLALANLYYSQREMLKEVIAEVDVLSLSLNNWKSVFGQNVLTVSGHWISQGFSRRDCVLEVYVLPLDESVNTIALLRDVMDKWEIPANKVAALTMLKNGNGNGNGNGSGGQGQKSNEDKAIHEEYPGLTVVNCFVSVLDNAVAAGLVKCAPLIQRCRNYVSYFIQNPSEYQIFLSLQRKVSEDADGVDHTVPDGVDEHESVDDHSGGGGVDENKAASTGESSPKQTSHHSGAGGASGSGGYGSHSSGTTATNLPLPALSVICDFEDRWNSTSEMICRIVELEQMLLLYKSNLESDTNPNRRPMQLRFVCCELSSDEWANLKELARLLEPIEGVVHVATNCEYPGLSIILPLLHSIQKHLDHAALWLTTTLVSTVRNTISSGLAAALPLCSCGAMPEATPYLSCLLDPRFKALPFLDVSEREQLVEMLQVLLGNDANHHHHHHHHHHTDKDGNSRSSATESCEVDKRAKAAAALGLGLKKGGLLFNTFFPLDSPTSQDVEPTSELDKLKAHVQLYLDSPSLPATDDRENDPLDWWSRYVRSFPGLAKLAKKYLCMSAVSVPFYEAFTNYGQLMREKKARLDIEVAAQILFCRSVSRIPEMERMNV